jgi:hypothetical protein
MTGQHLFARYDPTSPAPEKFFIVDKNKHRLELMDINSSLFHGASDSSFNIILYNEFLALASGVVLLYDITNLQSYSNITTKGYLHIYKHRKAVYMPPDPISNGDYVRGGVQYPCGGQRFGCVLVGMKKDLADGKEGKREVQDEMAREWAESQGCGFWEVDKWNIEGIEEVMRGLVRDVERKQRRDKEDIQEVKIREREREVSEKEGKSGLMETLRSVLPKSKSLS